MSDDEKPVHQVVIIGDYFGANPREQDGRVARALRSARAEMEPPDLRTRGARIAGAVSRIGWPIVVAVIVLVGAAASVIREGKIWGWW